MSCASLLPCHGRGRGFESRRSRHSHRNPQHREQGLLRAPGNLRARLGALLKIRLIKPIETHRKRTDQCKYLEDSDTAKQRSPGLCRAKAEAWSLGRSFRARESSRSLLTFLRRPAHIWPTGLRQTLQSSLLPAVRQSVERGPWQPANLAHRRHTILEPTRDFRIARQTSTTDNCDRRRPGKGGDCSAEP